ncbi:MAG TPA: PKD domain-containing protein [Chitinophagales bacterium]|mgnify:CR=1 FL=1|jgi:PKD repeat protein|nr:PKD domain-containing protein [Chitinophagales bacterium]HQW77918.1 PKD domain-containing protein [Chitinophagales bacterium]
MKMIFRQLFFIACLFLYIAVNAKVEIISPKNNSAQIDKNLTVTFNSDAYSRYYTVQIATSNTFSTDKIESKVTTTNNKFTKTFTDYGKYYIRARGNFDSNWSETIQINIVDIKNSLGLISWFKADTNNVLITGINSVNIWNDAAVTTRTATQFNNSQMPALLKNIPSLNNNNVISFNGDPFLPSRLYINETITAPNDFSLFTVQNFNTASTTNDIQYFLSGPVGGFWSEIKYLNGGFGLYGSNNTGIYSSASALSFSYSMFNYSSTYIEKNKASVPFVSLGGIADARRMNITDIGTLNPYSLYAYKGEIAEMIFYTNLADSTTKSNTYNYLQTKYAPPVNLGTDTVFGASFTDTIMLDAGNRFVRYLWSNGDTTPTTKVISSSTYSVKTTDIFGFESTDDIRVFPYRGLKNATVNLCPDDSITVNLGLDASYSTLWSNGKTTSAIVLKTPGQYVVTITKNGKTIKDTINVVANLDLTPLSYAPARDLNKHITICGGEEIYIQNDSLFVSFLWSTGSNTNVGTAFTSGNVLVNYIEKNGCPLTDTVSVVITGQAPTAKFGTNALCEDAATIFTDSSMAASGSTITQWQWTFGDGNTSFSNSPINIYTNSGTYNVGFKVSTNQGCADSISKTLVVNKRPTASFYNLLSCSGLPTTFVDQSNANAASNINWQWQFGNLGISNGIKNPTFQFSNAGAYNVTLAVTNSNNCRDSITLPISVNASPSAHFAFDSACGTSPIHFQYLATVQPPATLTSWKWEFGDGNIQTAIKNTDHIYPGPGAYNAKLTVFSSDQCSNTVEKEVKVFDFPVVDFSISPTQCVGKDIHFTDISYTVDGSPMANWNWYFSGQASSNQQHPTYAFQQQGNYTIQLTAKNNVGCSGTKLRSIAVSDPPIPKFTFSPQNGLPPLVVNFINQTATSSNFIWDFGDGSTPYIGQQAPAHTYNTLGSYPIKLTATDFRGCSDSLVKQILVDKAVLDAVMTGITLIPSGENYKVQITLVNNSNVEIRNLGLALQVGSGAQVVENWEGSLLPNQTLTYNFIGQVKLSDNSIPIVCANIDQVNHGATETRTDNNRTCKETAVGNFEVLSVYPNPAEEILNFGIMLPKNGSVNIQFIDVLGQYLQSKTFTGTKGYNLFPMNTMPLNAAVYVAEITFDGQTIRKKFMRKDK